MKREPLDVSVYMPVIVSDWLTGGATFVMNNRQRGAFFQLLCHAWKLDASLPNDLVAIAKYAEESPEWLNSPEGEAVLAQFPVDEHDGRRRNRKQVAVFADAVARREKKHKAAVTAANARWGNGDHGADEPRAPRVPEAPTIEIVRSTAAPNFADAISAFPAVVAYAALSPDHTSALHRALARVVETVGEASLAGFVGEVNAALGGMHGVTCSPDGVRRALEDWCDNCAAVNKRLLRAYFRGDRPSDGGSSPLGAGRPRPVSPVAKAGSDAAWKFGASQ